MSKTCGKCGFVNAMDSEFLSETECPKCGVVYKKEQQKFTIGGVSHARESSFRNKSSNSKPLLSVIFFVLALLSFVIGGWKLDTHVKGDYNIIIASVSISEGLFFLAIAQVLEFLSRIANNTER